jgi:hypothetical protein
MSLKRRVGRLTAQVRPGLCPQCRDRKGVLLLTGHYRGDGTFAPDNRLPEPCPACGETPEPLCVVVEQIVGSDGNVIPWED